MKFLDIFKKNVEKIGNMVAIVDGELLNQTTYFEIERLSNKVANKLLKNGIKSGDKVIVNLDRNAYYFIAEIGVLKVNSAFIPVMSTYPKDRIEYIKKDSNAKFIITKDFFNDIESFDDVFELSVIDDGLATILYTSGSTGKPKGVCWSKKVFDEILERSDSIFKDLDEIRYGTVAPMTFVVIFTDLFGVIRKGGITYLIPDEIKNDVNKIAKYYIENKLTCGFLPPRLNKMFKIDSEYLKQINVVGERVSNQYSNKYKILNLYGQTEGWMYTSYEIDKLYDNTPVGKVFPGIEIKIFDENENEVEKGKEGEICPIGIFPCEYNNLLDLTSKVFKKLNDGRVLIHTGDIGKIDENGNLLYINRKDNMIKLHGLRVEPGEIENVICSVDGVENAVAKAFEMEDETMVFCGFYTANKKIEKEIIQKKLEEKVPKYMIPTIIYQMEKFPINQNGKIDRKNILLPDINKLKNDYEKPVNEIEYKICEGFKKVFSIDEVGRNDNFYELGGNSLNSVKLASVCNIKNLNSGLIMRGMTPKEIAKLLIEEKIAIKPKIIKSNLIKDEYKMPKSFIYQYEMCKVYNAPMENISANLYYEIPKKIDMEKFEKAILDTINKNKIYKIGADIESEKIFIHNEEFKINKIFIKETDFKTYRENRCKKTINYKKDFLIEVDIICVDNGKKYFHFIMNHLIHDIITIKNFLTSISNFYNSKKYNEEINMFDVSLYEENVEHSKFYYEAKEYYNSIYDSIQEFDLLKKEKKYSSVSVIPLIKDIKDDKLLWFFKKNHTSFLPYFLLALELTINKYFNKNDFTYINIYNGRFDDKLNNTHGGLARGVFIRSSFYKHEKINEQLKFLNDNYQKIIYYDVINFRNILKSYKNIRSGITFNYRDTLEIFLNLGDEFIIPSFIEEFRNVGIFVDMDVMISNILNKKMLIITSTKLSQEELNEFAKLYDDYCYYLLNNI